MKAIRELLSHVSAFSADDLAIMATVIDVQGSGYRRPGARMLILENGETFGTVSGGCLEADVLERAKGILRSGEAEILTYDTRENENSVFGLNMGCRGVIRILLEPVRRDSELLSLLKAVWSDREKVTVATFVGGDGVDKLDTGARVFVRKGRMWTDAEAMTNAVRLIEEDLLTFHESDSAYEAMMYVGEAGDAEFVFESLQSPIMLAIFGAGVDAVPLSKAASDLGWQVRVFDHRPALLTRERFPLVDAMTLVKRESNDFDLAPDRRTAIISINHNYDRDKESIGFALRTDAFYIGALGPKKRTERILAELNERGENLAQAALERFRYPAGLDIGGDTPESIAVAIVAEIQSVLKQRGGGALRDRNGSIYDRTQVHETLQPSARGGRVGSVRQPVLCKLSV